MFSKLYEDPITPFLQTRLPALHSQQLVKVLEKFAAQQQRLGNLQGEYCSLEMWHETNAEKDGTIKRQTQFPVEAQQWIVSGPHFFVGTPFYQTPRATCIEKGHYDVLDLTNVPIEYLPRTNYIPACNATDYQRNVPRVSWVEEGESKAKYVTEYFRIVFRAMIGSWSERTLSGAIIPKRVAHTNGARSYVFKRSSNLLLEASITASLPFDFLLKTTGKSNLHRTLEDFPIIKGTRFDESLKLRILALSSLTIHYKDLWQSCYQTTFNQDHWAKSDPAPAQRAFPANLPQTGNVTALYAPTTTDVNPLLKLTC